MNASTPKQVPDIAAWLAMNCLGEVFTPHPSLVASRDCCTSKFVLVAGEIVDRKGLTHLQTFVRG